MMTAGYMNLFILVTSLGPLSSVIQCYHHTEYHFCQMSWIFVSQRDVRAGRSPLKIKVSKCSWSSCTGSHPCPILTNNSATELVKAENAKLPVDFYR